MSPAAVLWRGDIETARGIGNRYSAHVWGRLVGRKLDTLVTVAGLACALGAAMAADEAAAPAKPATADTPVEKVTVTATRQKRKADEVPATVTVITSKELEDNMATDVKDVVRFEPGVSVRANPSRFSAASSSLGRDGNSGSGGWTTPSGRGEIALDENGRMGVGDQCRKRPMLGDLHDNIVTIAPPGRQGC